MAAHHLLHRFVVGGRLASGDQIMDAMATGPDAAVQMIDTSSCAAPAWRSIAEKNHQDMGTLARGSWKSQDSAVVEPIACRSISPHAR